ncbi:Uncharacterized protein ESCO_003693 [Escovopsis weberi]|uniref:TRIP4/RQT4 C2HC5-type zinc finger domain-containing protein n=1 Tax=Escovopsis weberi TaxID=150374 RepID=A0A0M9VX67_ESCWE|nr:Uncharacterized protein ESCO_003693 [Escovopsis weberi]
MSLAQLSQLLPLPEEELQQVLDYALTLSKAEAASHFSNLLGDSPLAVDFISSFNSRRRQPQTPAPTPAPATSQPAAAAAAAPAAATTPGAIAPVPKWGKQSKKKKAAIHTPQARKVGDYAGPAGKAYNKKDADLEYMAPQRDSTPSTAAPSRHASRPSTPPKPKPEPVSAPQAKPAQPAPKQNITTAAGYLISDMPKKGKDKSAQNSRSSTPKPAAPSTGNVTKVSISGGVPMAGQSTALADLDLAIRSLEITTNPTLDNVQSRRCNCVATRHPLQAAAPNCLSCGKVVCLREGLGPCTFCGTPILSSGDIQAMIRELKDERGREKMAANAAAHRKPDAAAAAASSRTPRREEDSGGNTNSPSLAEAAARARDHRDKLLNFQANNAKRTTVHDEAADFDVSGAMSGMGSMWATPEERARELKRQQKLMREMEWNARPEYEKRQQIVSIDLSGRRVVKTIGSVQRPASPEEDGGENDEDEQRRGEEEKEEEEAEGKGSNYRIGGGAEAGRTAGGAFSSNPLLGAVMRPVFEAEGKGKGEAGRRERKKGWRRVQDDLDDNEGVILDGGALGRAGGGDEPECG